MFDSDAASESLSADLEVVDRNAYYQEIDEIGPYELTRLLGSGGMSRVYHGRHRRTGQEVAIKILRPELLERANVVRRFRAEFRAARKLFHPNLVRAFDFGVEQGLAYLVLEYVDGPSLFDRIREKLRLSQDEAVPLIQQTAEGLRAAHASNFIHRDVKPANILIAPGEIAKLSDLGLAKDLLSDEAITRSGASLGTLHYMAPEQFMNARAADARADLYSLGVTLYHALVGRLPFAGGQLTMLRKKLANQFVPPRDLVPEIRPALNALISQLLRSNPEERPASCEEVIAQLGEASESSACARFPASDLPPAAANAGGTNRRAEDRYATSLQSSCAMLMDPRKQSWKGQIVDISSGGAHLLVSRRFEVGSLVAVDVDDDSLEESLSFMIRVTWVRPGDETGLWRVGGKFHRRVPPSELQRLLHRELQTVVLQDA